MQEVRVELKQRLLTLERKIVRTKNEREQHVADIAMLDADISASEILVKQYKQVLSSLNVSLTYVGNPGGWRG